MINNRNKFFSLAKQSHIPLGDWFISPLHPIQENFHLWKLDKKDIPKAAKISMELVNLPTNVSDSKKIIEFLDKYKQYII